jgi:hypothetical protein
MRKSTLSLDDLVVTSFETDRMVYSQLQSPSIDNPTPQSYCEVCPDITDNC